MYQPDLHYSPGQIRQIIEHYHELRSKVELVATRYDQDLYSHTKRIVNGADDTLCMLLDLDRAMILLSLHQKTGYRVRPNRIHA